MLVPPHDCRRWGSDNGKVAQMKKCSACGESKLDSEFHKNKVSPPSETRQCRVCTNAKRRAWRNGDIVARREKEARKASAARARMSPSDRHGAHLKRHHGMTAGQYWAMLDLQGGGCAICHKPEQAVSANPASNQIRMMSVDHDHACCAGKRSCGQCVRGLLCSRCNAGLGNLNDDIGLLTSAIAYLSAWDDLVRPALEGFYGSV